VAPEEGEASVHPVTGARRAAALHPAAQEVSAVVVHRGAVAVHHGAVGEVLVVAAVAEVAAAVDAGKQDLEKNKGCRLVADHYLLITDDRSPHFALRAT
jgi:hypothetical protein